MNWYADRVGRLTGVAVAVVLVAAGVAAQESLPVENVRLPLEHGKDGRIKRQLYAGTAVIPPEGPIRAKAVRVESFGTDGKVETVLTAETCTFDRRTGTASSEDRVRFETKDAVITGKGFTWNSADQMVVILSEARVEFNRKITKPGKKP